MKQETWSWPWSYHNDQWKIFLCVVHGLTIRVINMTFNLVLMISNNFVWEVINTGGQLLQLIICLNPRLLIIY